MRLKSNNFWTHFSWKGAFCTHFPVKNKLWCFFPFFFSYVTYFMFSNTKNILFTPLKKIEIEFVSSWSWNTLSAIYYLFYSGILNQRTFAIIQAIIELYLNLFPYRFYFSKMWILIREKTKIVANMFQQTTVFALTLSLTFLIVQGSQDSKIFKTFHIFFFLYMLNSFTNFFIEPFPWNLIYNRDYVF